MKFLLSRGEKKKWKILSCRLPEGGDNKVRGNTCWGNDKRHRRRDDFPILLSLCGTWIKGSTAEKRISLHIWKTAGSVRCSDASLHFCFIVLQSVLETFVFVVEHTFDTFLSHYSSLVPSEIRASNVHFLLRGMQACALISGAGMTARPKRANATC